MRVTVEYTLPEERDELERDMRASDLQSALWAVTQGFRHKVKYEDLPEDEARVWEKAQAFVYDALRDHDLESFF